CQQGDTNPPTF
nr:immunoglobulin light chain junction region [Macaca mulatta]